MNIIEQARELYSKTISNPEYKKSHIWEDQSQNHRNMQRIISVCSTPEQVISELSELDHYNIRISDQYTFDLMMRWYEQRFYDPPNTRFCTTPNLWKMYLYCKDIIDHCTAFKTVIELGGGNGQFAYMARNVLGTRLHIDIDIPESLYMAYVCTRHLFPQASCLWVDQEAVIKLHNENFDFIFCPVSHAEIFSDKEFDLFVNTASMGELPNETIRYWMDFVQNKIKVKYFFGFNRFLNTILPEATDGFSSYRRNENEASVLFDNNWNILKWEIEPQLARCPYEDPKIARYLEIILQRLNPKRALKDDEVNLEDLKMEDWWRYRHESALGTHRSNQLVNDMTMDGTLFKLWNAMRLAPCRETAEMMLKYLNHIGRPALMFEEEYFYRKFL